MTYAEQTGRRSLAVSRARRIRLGRLAHWFDIDGEGVCHLCQMPLYVEEDTRRTDHDTRHLMRTAMMLNVPGFLVQYVADREDTLLSMTVAQIWPERHRVGDERDWWRHEVALRTGHLALCHDYDATAQDAMRTALLVGTPPAPPASPQQRA